MLASPVKEAEQPRYQDFRDLARGIVRDDPTEGFAFLLQLVCEELAEDLPGLFGSVGIADLIPVRPPPCAMRWKN